MAGESGGDGGSGPGASSGADAAGGGAGSADSQAPDTAGQGDSGQGGDQSAGDLARANSARTETKADAKRRLKLKMEGKEVEWDEDRVIAAAQRSTVADKRFQEASQRLKEAEAKERFSKTGDLDEFIEAVGQERFHKMSEQYWRNLLDEQDMDPREKSLRQKEKELEKRAKEFKRQEETRQEVLSKQLEKHYTQQFDQEITAALKSSKLPKNAYSIKRMAELMEKNLEMEARDGIPALPAKTVAKILEDEMRGSVSELFAEMDPDALGEFLGDNISAKLRERDLRKLKNPSASSARQSSGSGVTDDQSPPPKKGPGRTRPGSAKQGGYDAWKERMARIKAGQE